MGPEPDFFVVMPLLLALEVEGRAKFFLVLALGVESGAFFAEESSTLVRRVFWGVQAGFFFVAEALVSSLVVALFPDGQGVVRLVRRSTTTAVPGESFVCLAATLVLAFERADMRPDMLENVSTRRTRSGLGDRNRGQKERLGA